MKPVAHHWVRRHRRNQAVQRWVLQQAGKQPTADLAVRPLWADKPHLPRRERHWAVPPSPETRTREMRDGPVGQSSTGGSQQGGMVAAGGQISPASDRDADGHNNEVDCQPDDPNIYPGADEICDNLDQDCDMKIDESVPNDGNGCVDPGLPDFPNIINRLQLIVRTGQEDKSGTDDAIEFCLSAVHCFSINKPQWDDAEKGLIDVITHENINLMRNVFDRFTVRSEGGSDRWKPECFQVLYDGENIHCQETPDLYIGNDANNEQNPWRIQRIGVRCTTCFDQDGARIWFRTDATRQVIVRVSDTREEVGQGPPVHYAYPKAEDDMTYTAHIRGLRPDTLYWYELEIAGERYGPWSFKTAPLPDTPTRMKFAFGSCSKYDTQPIFGTLSLFDPDVFIFIGDNHYGDTPNLSANRQYYRWAHERPLRKEFMRERSILATWDDHDYVGNNTDGSDAGKENAIKAFSEYWANASYGVGNTRGAFTRQRYGEVEFFLIDDRYFRGIDGKMLGPTQEQWLIDSLSESTATFKFIGSGSQWTPDGSNDSWASFDADRQRIFDAIVARRIEGVVLLSGDVHFSEFLLLSGSAGGYSIPELTSSPLANSNSRCAGHRGAQGPCLDDDYYFVGVTVDTTLEDPTLEASIFSLGGVPLSTWTIRLSQLQIP